MRLREAPGAETLARLYHELGRLGARAEGEESPWPYGNPTPEETISLTAQASRYDARLLWILVEFLATRYDRLNPLALRRTLADARWPAALGVAFEFARRAAPSAELDDYAAFVMRRIPPAGDERFFIFGPAFAGELMRRDVAESLDEYRRWGFYGREEPLAKELGGTARGTLGPEARLHLLRRLAERHGSISVADYVDALRGRASPRQARRDLAEASFLEKTGRTRGTRYRFIGDPGDEGPGATRARERRRAARANKTNAGRRTNARDTPPARRRLITNTSRSALDKKAKPTGPPGGSPPAE